ncbi:hypothetical protein [Pseudomonas sp. 58 R 12]|uniref:hypothetical protein n=1 Tax=Pseudomonas sp. 58 R 12 TaxID=1844107 RepID=UPI0008127943|nr:hypothetical protein [Pseudomonas sp. 58 R 12]CRM50483.1 hypothetical protein [Pseudomonas sp. 58 R 12]
MTAKGIRLTLFLPSGFDHFMNTFSFRADTIHHVFELMLGPGMKGVHRLTILPDPIFPDVEEELLAEITQDKLMRLVASVNDAHVIGDTHSPM